jgi:quinol monooxygenase YgiN
MVIKHIVRMQFRKERAAEFLKIFRENCEAIRAADGCLSLELLQDTNDPATYMTLSLWQSEEALAAYRKSAVFKSTWKKTKALFRKKAEAWSLTSYIAL